MNNEDIAQFKFSSGQEIVCEVMEWPDDSSFDIIVRNAMSIVAGETPDGERVYMFKPWVHYLESPTEYICVNSSHVISQNRPNRYLIKEYISAVTTMHEIASEREEEYKREEKANLARLQKGMTNVINRSDSIEELESSNVLKFPSKDDLIH